MKACLILLYLLCGLILPCNAQNSTDSIQGNLYPLFFNRDEVKIDTNYLNNASQLDSLCSMLAKYSHIDSVNIYAYSSPEGTKTHNLWLSQQRAESIRDFIIANLPKETKLRAQDIHLFPMGENWHGLTKELEANYNLMNRDRVLKIMYAEVPGDTKKWRLRNLDNGFTYRWIIQHHMSTLRVATWVGIYSSEPKPETKVESAPMQKIEQTIVPEDTVPAPVIVPVTANESGLRWALKTNLLYDAVLVPNIGAEFYLGNQMSIAADWHYAWWNTDDWYWRTYGGEVAVRKWIGRNSKENPFTGHHIGIYGQILIYDFLTGNKGYMSGKPGQTIFDKPSYGIGLEYGFSLPVARKLNLDFVIGVGYHGGTYNEYRIVDDCYVWQAQKKRSFFGPTKAEITLSWLLGRNHQNTKKGGAR